MEQGRGGVRWSLRRRAGLDLFLLGVVLFLLLFAVLIRESNFGFSSWLLRAAPGSYIIFRAVAFFFKHSVNESPVRLWLILVNVLALVLVYAEIFPFFVLIVLLGVDGLLALSQRIVV